MEAAPLTLAQTHARNAVLETRKSNPVAASEEHDLAAGEFSAAAQSSGDLEALRTLQLLENHHKKLAKILRFQHEHPISSQPELSSISPARAAQLKQTPTSHDPLLVQQPPRLPTNHRLPPSRESSSIASNLASARGIIPAQSRRAAAVSPTLSSQQAGATMADSPSRLGTGELRLRGAQSSAGTRDRPNRAPASMPSQSPPPASPTDVTAQQFVPADAAESHFDRTKTVASDEPFQRFYSTFEGLISKLSAPLAFAGLPLSSEAAGHESIRRKATAETKVDRHNATSDRFASAAEPDVNRLFSRAALRAIRDTTGKVGGNAAESFYVVPTTGGTVSYAGILSRAEKEARRNSLEEGDDDFVDARETPASPEMRQNLSASRGKSGTTSSSQQRPHQFNNPLLQYPKTMEELQMENQTLKQLTDTLSKRLHMWEVNAQSSSMALQQSLKAMHHHRASSPDHHSATAPSSNIASPTATFTSGGAVVTTPAQDAGQRVKELEDRVRRGEKDLERMGRENEKLRSVLGRYRERWEKLKEGAKTRRAEGKAGGTSTGGGGVEHANLGTAEIARDSEDTVGSSAREGVSPSRADGTMVDLEDDGGRGATAP